MNTKYKKKLLQQKLNMETIAFYISDHGFGHASRNIPIIRYILEANKNIKIVIKTGKNQCDFIKDNLKELNARVEYHKADMDVGLVLKDNSLDIDSEKLKDKVTKYIASWDKKIQEEKEFVKTNNIKLIVSDIVPWIFKVGNELNIKTILISNFTWVEIYKEYLEKEIVNKYVECYSLASLGILYELHIKEMKEYLKNTINASFVARDFNNEKAKKIKEQFSKKIVFVSVGRSVELKDIINVETLPYQFIATEGIKLTGSNVLKLPINTENTQDYVLASDYVISKAGFGTISEIMLAGKKSALLSREFNAEDRNSIKLLKERNLAIEVNINELKNIENVLNKLEESNLNGLNKTYKNDYKNVGKIITTYL